MPQYFCTGIPMMLGAIVLNGATLFYYFRYCYPKVRYQEVENRGGYLATLPLMQAEKDRA